MIFSLLTSILVAHLNFNASIGQSLGHSLEKGKVGRHHNDEVKHIPRISKVSPIIKHESVTQDFKTHFSSVKSKKNIV